MKASRISQNQSSTRSGWDTPFKELVPVLPGFSEAFGFGQKDKLFWKCKTAFSSSQASFQFYGDHRFLRAENNPYNLVHILICSWADLKRACKLACISTETPLSAYYQIPCYHCVATLALYDMVGCTREQGSSTLTVYSSLLFLSHCVPITLFFSSA